MCMNIYIDMHLHYIPRKIDQVELSMPHHLLPVHITFFYHDLHGEDTMTS